MSGAERYSFESQCRDKKPYRLKETAKRACRKAEQRFGRMSPYRCTWCGQWHIGHKPKRRMADGA